MTKKPLNIGLIGYGFMGRTHSNAYKRVGDFFDLEYQPVLKAVCGRTEERTKGFAAQWGYETTETDWRKLVERNDIDAIDIYFFTEKALVEAIDREMESYFEELGI